MRTFLTMAFVLFAALFAASPAQASSSEDARVKVEVEKVCEGEVCGAWYTFQSAYAPFPDEKASKEGMCNRTPASKVNPDISEGKCERGKEFLPPSAFQDNSISIFVPDSVQNLTGDVNAVVYFHGVTNHLGFIRNEVTNKGRYGFAKSILAEHANVVLVVPQGPYEVWSNYWGRMREQDGLKNMLSDVRRVLSKELNTDLAAFDHLVVSGQSGGFEGVGFTVKVGGVKIDEVWIFDALYGLSSNIRDWVVENQNGILRGAHTKHLAANYHDLERSALARGVTKERIKFVPANVVHPRVTGRYFAGWLRSALQRWSTEAGAPALARTNN
jgi:hypothetical protein